MRNYLIIITLLIFLISACQKSNEQIQLKYLGAAGWVITDGGTKVLIDPYLSRIKLVGRSTSSKISNAAKIEIGVQILENNITAMIDLSLILQLLII